MKRKHDRLSKLHSEEQHRYLVSSLPFCRTSYVLPQKALVEPKVGSCTHRPNVAAARKNRDGDLRDASAARPANQMGNVGPAWSFPEFLISALRTATQQ